jgi:hypothetical protein
MGIQIAFRFHGRPYRLGFYLDPVNQEICKKCFELEKDDVLRACYDLHKMQSPRTGIYAGCPYGLEHTISVEK